MRDKQATRARRVDNVESDPLVSDRPHDYADCFEIHFDEPDERSAEAFARSALEEAPRTLRWIMRSVQRHLLRFELASPGSPEHVEGWKIVHVEPERIQLEALSPLGRAVVVGQRSSPTSAVMTTYNFYKRPALGRALWALAAPMHRRIARYLLERAAAARRAPTSRET